MSAVWFSKNEFQLRGNIPFPKMVRVRNVITCKSVELQGQVNPAPNGLLTHVMTFSLFRHYGLNSKETLS